MKKNLASDGQLDSEKWITIFRIDGRKDNFFVNCINYLHMIHKLVWTIT